jgi:hypothetical protein
MGFQMCQAMQDKPYCDTEQDRFAAATRESEMHLCRTVEPVYRVKHILISETARWRLA